MSLPELRSDVVAAVKAPKLYKWLDEKCDWECSVAMQEGVSFDAVEVLSVEFHTIEFDWDEGSEFDYAGEISYTNIERKRDLLEDCADPPHSPRLRWHRYYYDGWWRPAETVRARQRSPLVLELSRA